MAIKRFRLRHLIAPFLLVAFLVYLATQALFGSKGYFALGDLRQLEKERQQILNEEQAKNDRLENEIEMLGTNLDLDFLEERARDVLGFSKAGEKIVPTP